MAVVMVIGGLWMVVGSPPAAAGSAECDTSTVDAATSTGVTITVTSRQAVTVEVRGRQLFVNGTRCISFPAQGNFTSAILGTAEVRENVTLVMSTPLEVGGSGAQRFRVDLASSSAARDRFTLKTLENATRETVFPWIGGVIVNDYEELGTIAQISFNQANSSYLNLVVDGRGGPDVLDGRSDQSGPFPVTPFGGRLTLRGGPGRDSVIGGANDDVLNGGAGRDKLKGVGGADRFEARDGEVDSINGGPGNDTCRCDPNDTRVSVEN